MLEVVQELVDHEFDFSDHHGVAMLKRLLRHEARVDAAHHDRGAAGAKPVGDFIAAVDITRHRGNPDEVGLQPEIDGLDVLVRQHHFVSVARDHRGDGEQAGKRRIQRALEIDRAGRQ